MVAMKVLVFTGSKPSVLMISVRMDGAAVAVRQMIGTVEKFARRCERWQ